MWERYSAWWDGLTSGQRWVVVLVGGPMVGLLLGLVLAVLLSEYLRRSFNQPGW